MYDKDKVARTNHILFEALFSSTCIVQNKLKPKNSNCSSMHTLEPRKTNVGEPILFSERIKHAMYQNFNEEYFASRSVGRKLYAHSYIDDREI